MMRSKSSSALPILAGMGMAVIWRWHQAVGITLIIMGVWGTNMFGRTIVSPLAESA